MNIVRAAVFASALAVPMAATTSAQPVVTGGLVNVTITNLATNVLRNSNVSLGVALALAANVCDVNVNVLARQLRDGGATCESATERVTISPVQQQ